MKRNFPLSWFVWMLVSFGLLSLMVSEKAWPLGLFVPLFSLLLVWPQKNKKVVL